MVGNYVSRKKISWEIRIVQHFNFDPILYFEPKEKKAAAELAAQAAQAAKSAGRRKKSAEGTSS